MKLFYLVVTTRKLDLKGSYSNSQNNFGTRCSKAIIMLHVSKHPVNSYYKYK